jgi:hypothetical protein
VSGAFTVVLPSQLFAAASGAGAAPVTVTLPGGGALPSWLSFDPVTLTFNATNAPASGLPISVTLSVGGTLTTITFKREEAAQ